MSEGIECLRELSLMRLKMCFLFHKWGRWNYRVQTIIKHYPSNKIKILEIILRERDCNKCEESQQEILNEVWTS